MESIGRTGHNELQVGLFARGSTTPVIDVGQDLRRLEDLTFSTFFPGGLFGEAAFFVPRSADLGWRFNGGQRLVIRNGQHVCYEGQVTAVGYEVGDGGRQGRSLTAAGYWGQILGVRGWRKPWADTRVDDKTWVNNTTVASVAAAEKYTGDRQARIRFTPKGVAWNNLEFAEMVYNAPTGETIKRVTCDYDLQEAAQAWRVAMVNSARSVNHWTVNATGTGSQDVTLGTPEAVVRLVFQAEATQTPTEDGVYYGQVSNVVVYTETGSINAQEILRDIIGRLSSELNSDETRLGALTLALVPFVSNGWEMLNSIAQRAVEFGDSSYNAWNAYLMESDAAATPNGRPVLALAQYPALTDYDYAVRLDEPNLVGGVSVKKDFDGIRNWIIVRYQIPDGREVYLTPDDDSTLTDTTSTTAYGRREKVMDVGLSDSTEAANIGRRLLAAYKDPKFYVSGPLTVRGYIRGKGGQRIPAANLRAGKRIKIENFLTDEAGVAGAGLTFLISQTTYRDADETCALTTGVPDDLAVFLARVEADF